MKTNNYEILNENTALKYSVETLNFFKNENDLFCKEIGDGNLNNVFRVVNSVSGKSIILKQSLPYARTSVEMKLDAKRGEIEAMGLLTQGKLSPSMVPVIYNYDSSKYIIAMEDLTGYEILRSAMIKGVESPTLGKNAAVFFANTLLRTSDIVLDSKSKKDEVIKFINKDLCDLTENLVLTNSAFMASRNKIDNQILDFVKDNIFNDKKVALEVAKLKHKFMTNAQALLHGDAHTGSIFIKKNSIKFIDTEFSFYGPIGFDVGMFLANLFMNACYHKALGNIKYKNYVLDQIESFIDSFKKEFFEIWEKYATEHFAKTNNEFKIWYLDNILSDIAGYCACEMIRRTTGSSHVKEMDDFDSKDTQKKAQMKNLALALQLLFNQEKFKSGEDYKKFF
ncbi:S-methyl-5-thioribose kinase [Cetobacterium sp.]|uniref:S-methyl-5-thioribose kinase n=1 Tax=Cetobacterium sp. TaxID=2071632 RepID=UPI003F3FA1F9